MIIYISHANLQVLQVGLFSAEKPSAIQRNHIHVRWVVFGLETRKQTSQ